MNCLLLIRTLSLDHFILQLVIDLAPISDKILTDAVKGQGVSADVAMRQLVNKGIGMVKFMAARSNGLSYDDACSRGLEGLWTAAMKYDSDKGASFITYARKWVYRNTRNRGNKSDISLPGLSDKWITEDTSNSLPSVESWSMTEDIQGALDKIDESSRDIVRLRFFEGMKIDDIGKELGISKPTVISRITKAKEKLRIHLKGYEHG